MRSSEEILKYFESRMPFDLQEKWDRSDVWFELPQNLSTIGIALEVEDFSSSEFEQVDAVIVHHPPYLNAESEMSRKQREAIGFLKAANKGFVVCHTNADLCAQSFVDYLLKKAGIEDAAPFQKTYIKRKKVVTYLPKEYAFELAKNLRSQRLGIIGLYEGCCYFTEGTGHFCASHFSKPFVGEKGKCSFEEEYRLEFEVSQHDLNRAVEFIASFHPYEEPVIEVYDVERFIKGGGYGRIFEFNSGLGEFVELLAKQEIEVINTVKANDYAGVVAFLPGSGRKFVADVIKYRVSTLVTGDLGYHEKKTLEQENINLVEVSHDSVESWFVDWLSQEINVFFPDLKTIKRRRKYGKYGNS